MKKIVLLFAVFFALCDALFAQTPGWAVKESDYQYTMTFLAKLTVDGKRLTNPNDKVAAFVGNTCRGLSSVTYVANEKAYYAFLTVFSNSQGESISFKLYDSANNKIATVSKPVVFVTNQHLGNLFQSYSIAEPTLNRLSDIIAFNFMDIKSLSSIINGGTVNINISERYLLTNLKPVFTLSTGATLLKNRVVQKSGEMTENFSSPITYEVLSEDESTINSYKVSVTQSLDPNLFYKKNAVCYAAGAIKIVSKREGASVSVSGNGKTIATKLITNGEALFPNLEAGSYVATIGSEFKVINILLKDK